MKLTYFLIPMICLGLIACKDKPKSTDSTKTDVKKDDKTSSKTDAKKVVPKDTKKVVKKGDKSDTKSSLILKVISPEEEGTREKPYPIKNALKFEDRTFHVVGTNVYRFDKKEGYSSDFLVCKAKNNKDLLRVDVLINNTSKETMRHIVYPIVIETEDGKTALPSARCPLLRNYASLTPVKPGDPAILTILYEVRAGKKPAFLKYKTLKRDYFFKLFSDKAPNPNRN